MLRMHSSSVKSLPHHVIELIMERLPVKSLLRFKSVSKNWKSTIESPTFKQEQLIRRRLSQGPDVLFIPISTYRTVGISPQKFMFGSSVAHTVKLPETRDAVCRGSCEDGLVCLYNIFDKKDNVVVNPATGWHKSFPISSIQQLLDDMAAKRNFSYVIPYLGFGKDNVTCTYKALCLYNSSEYGLDNVTTCEVFDFTTNSWRYVLPASPHRILDIQEPLHFHGSFYWLTEGEETNVLSFDLHTETFRVISKAPFSHSPNHRDVTLCVLDNRLCLTRKNWPTQVIWFLDLCSKTWKEMCCIDLSKTFEWFGKEPYYVLFPIAILDKNKLLLKGRDYFEPVLIHDLDTKSCDLLFEPSNPTGAVCYFESLLSV